MRLLTLLVLAACSGATTSAPRPQVVDTAPRIAFRPVEITPSHLDARGPSATTSVAVDGREVAIDLHTLYRSGEGGFGVLHDADGAPIPRVCDEQDFNALHEAHGEIWLTSHFECTPGGIYLTRLAQDPTTGLLSTLDTHEIDATGVHGLWFPCSGQVSPWGTHLGSEEYEPNARGWSSDGQPFASASYGWAEMMAWFPDPSVANPYRYGWTPEVTVTDAAGATTLVKHLAPGRFSHEIAYVLPDRRTTYLSDDGYGGGLFLFVADAPTDLSAGWLYALRWDQLEGASDRAAVAWVPLGHATDAAIEALIEAKVGFDELFEATEPQGTTCPEGFSWVHTRFRAECLKLRPPSARVPDPAMAASRLETRRFAAMKGASTELNKGEGVTYDPRKGQLFVSMSSIDARMLAEPGEPVDHVRLPRNPCGAVLGGYVAADRVDTEGRSIPSDLVVTELHIQVAGSPIDADAMGNLCDPQGIANPDNLTFLPGFDLLTIGEDTALHPVASLWVQHPQTRELTRIAVAPRGGEVTGIHWIPDLRGFGYLTLAIQHPWGELNGPAPAGLTDADKRSYTGYIGPFPSLKR